MQSTLAAADIHLRPESADTVIACLDRMLGLARELEVQRLVLLGDVYHAKYAVPIALQNRLLDWILAAVRFFPLVILPGNHDQDNAAGRHALEVFGAVPGVTVHTEPGWDSSGVWLPYRRDPSVLVRFLEQNPRPASSPRIGWLHHGVVGALMNTNVIAGALDGIHPSVFSRAGLDVVFAGHWHRHQQIDPVVYVGSPWQTRADEAGQTKGFLHITDQGWRHIPIRIGPRFHRMQAGQALPDVGPQDHVLVVPSSAASTEAAVEQLRSRGAEVTVAPPPQEFAGDRLGLGGAASAREVAAALARREPGDLDPEQLIRVLDRLTS